MMRVFLALAPADATRDALEDLQEGLPGANWTDADNMHVTLLFLGDQSRRALEDLDAELLSLSAPSFELEFSGVGHFNAKDSRIVFAGIPENPALRRLQAKIAQAARRAGLAFDERRYHPHATLARWRRGEMSGQALQDYEARWNLFRSAPMPVTEFHLYQSTLSRNGPTYTRIASYTLRRD